MQQGTGEREPAPGGVTLRRGHHRKTEANENDANVFNAVVGQQTFEIVVDEMPTRAGIDPYNKLVDRISDDNTIDVTKP